MYPSDDGPIRLRLLTAQCREVRQRLEQQITHLQALRAAGASRRPLPAPHAAAPSDDLHEEG